MDGQTRSYVRLMRMLSTEAEGWVHVARADKGIGSWVIDLKPVRATPQPTFRVEFGVLGGINVAVVPPRLEKAVVSYHGQDAWDRLRKRLRQEGQCFALLPTNDL